MADAATAQNFRTLAAYLEDLNLGALFSVDGAGNPGGWLWDKLKEGVDTAEELRAAVEQTDVWRNEYSVILAQREQRAQGMAVQVMTPKEVIEYKARSAQIMRQYGLPAWFYDQSSDFNGLITDGVSVAELEERIGQAYNVVANMDPNIREAFVNYYGVGNDDAALASYFLDPDHTQAELDKVSRAAYAGGIAKTYGFQLSRDRAELFSLTDRQPAGIAQDMSEINALGDQLDEGYGESGDLTADDAFDAVVMGNADARRRLEGRVIARRAVDQASQGGALMTNQGLTGVGTAH